MNEGPGRALQALVQLRVTGLHARTMRLHLCSAVLRQGGLLCPVLGHAGSIVRERCAASALSLLAQTKHAVRKAAEQGRKPSGELDGNFCAQASGSIVRKRRATVAPSILAHTNNAVKLRQ